MGFDFLWIEMEHSPITLETARNMILATRGLKATSPSLKRDSKGDPSCNPAHIYRRSFVTNYDP
jgi:2-keto-3-deoxy-L-rhamnonate aldolase RhmA